MAQVRVTPSGNLDKDGELSYINNGNYVDANDIRHRQIVGNNFGSISGINGNLNLLTVVNGSAGTTLPAIGTTTKLYRVYLDYSYITNGVTNSYTGTLVLIRPSTGAVLKTTGTYTHSTGNDLENLALQMRAGFNGLHASFSPFSFTMTPSGSPYYVSTGTDTGYFTMTTTGESDFEIRIDLADSAIKWAKVVLVDEYVATATTLRPIGSYQLEDYMFLWSASETTSGNKSIVSELGVVYSTNQGVSYEYKTLCRSKNLGFFKERRIDAQVERVGSQINFYWTDGNTKPRAMYLPYANATTQNGFMYWEGGRYEHDSIDDETAFFFKVSNAFIDNISVVNEGGSIICGNKRYTGRFLTEDLVTTEFLYPTNPINIYQVDTIIPSTIYGDESNVLSTKSVNMVVRNITPGIYKFFELVVIEYVDDAFNATIVQRYTLDEIETELNVSHVGSGQDNIPLGINELLAIYTRYTLAENIRIFDNRVVFSNVTQQVDLDLQNWASQIQHSLESKTIPALGNAINNYHDLLDNPVYTTQPSTPQQNLNYNLNEFLNPLNTLNNTSYMYNDTYRFGIQVKWKGTGKWSAAYYVDDIRFDSLSYNISSTDTKRIANNITSNLTDSTNQNVYINYVKFHNLDLEYSVNGVPLRELIEGYRFVRAERIPEVLATGYFILGKAPSTTVRECFDITSGSSKGSFNISQAEVNSTTDTITLTSHGLSENEPLYMDYAIGGPFLPISQGRYYYVNVVNANEIKLREIPDGPTLNLDVPSTGVLDIYRGNNTNTHTLTPINGSNVLFFHSPDHFYIDRNYEFDVSVNSLKILGPSKPSTMITFNDGTGAPKRGTYADFTGYFSSSKREYLEINDTGTLHIDDYILLDIKQQKTLPTSGLVVKNKGNLLNDVFGLNTTLRPSTGSYFSAGLANSEAEGVYYGQIFIDLGADKKYPANRENTVYHSTGHFYYLTNSDAGIKNNIEVFGGDVYTQKTHLPISLRQTDTHPVLIGCYSQNLVNTQMMSIQEDPGDGSVGYRWPVYNDYTTTAAYNIKPIDYYLAWTTTKSIWTALIRFFAQINTPQRFYNRSYDFKDRTLIEQGYNKNINNYTGESPSKVIWSAKKATSSFRDSYRLGFGPTEFAELDLSYGPIVHHEVINNSFYTLQPFSFQRQYFRDASLIGAQEGTDVVVGSGSILGAPGQELTSIGAEYKWSQIKGQTEGGKESFYWYNNRLKKIMRFGQDGVRPISDRGVITLLQKNTNWLLDKKYPLSGAGIHGVWNDKYNEAIFTFKAINPNIAAWASGTSYTIGTYVFISPSTTYLHSSGLPYVYKALTNHTAASGNKPKTGASWTTNWVEIVPGTDEYAHTCLTLVYDELKNGFVSTHSYWPDIYMPYQNTFWSPNPNAKNTIFLHDKNTNQVYYGSNYNPSITAVMNYDPNMSKNFEAIQVNSEEFPYGVDFFTKNHQSYLDETEWERREDYYYSPIKNDILTAPLGTPIEDTSRLWGKWLKIKMYFESVNNKQRLVNFVVKFRPMARLYNQ